MDTLFNRTTIYTILLIFIHINSVLAFTTDTRPDVNESDFTVCGEMITESKEPDPSSGNVTAYLSSEVDNIDILAKLIHSNTSRYAGASAGEILFGNVLASDQISFPLTVVSSGYISIPSYLDISEYLCKVATFTTVATHKMGIAFDSSGNMYYGEMTSSYYRDTANNRARIKISLKRLDTQGNLYDAGTLLDISGYIDYATFFHIAINQDDEIYYSLPRIVDYDTDYGEYEVQSSVIKQLYAGTIIADLHNAVGLAFDSYGNMYFGDLITSNPSKIVLKKLEANGNIEELGVVVNTEAGYIDQLVAYNFDIAINKDDEVYYTLPSIINYYDEAQLNKYEVSSGGIKKLDGDIVVTGLNHPISPTFDSRGSMYFGDISSTSTTIKTTLKKLDLDGELHELGVIVDTSAGYTQIPITTDIAISQYSELHYTVPKVFYFDGSDLNTYKEISSSAIKKITLPNEASIIQQFYQNFLDRSAENFELQYWISQLQASSITAVALEFFNSSEFKERGAKINNPGFVNILYNTLLLRAPNATELQYWTDLLDTNIPRIFILYDFVQSSEMEGLAESVFVEAYSESDDAVFKIYDFVRSLYHNILGREPELGGLHYWSSTLSDETHSASEQILSFFLSNEFSRHDYTGSTFIDIAYQAILNRSAEVNAKSYWLQQLETEISREELIKRFIESDEFAELTVNYNVRVW